MCRRSCELAAEVDVDRGVDRIIVIMSWHLVHGIRVFCQNWSADVGKPGTKGSERAFGKLKWSQAARVKLDRGARN